MPSVTDDLFINKSASTFGPKALDLYTKMEAANVKLGEDITNPTNLIAYQKAQSAYSTYVNAATSFVKSIKDLDLAIIRNFN